MSRLDRIKAAQLAAGETVYQLDAPSEAKTLGFADHIDVDPRTGTLQDYQLAMQVDVGKIAAVQDIAEKIRIKQTVLPTYLNFVDRYVESGANYPNDVAVQVMIWQLDAGEIEYGLNLGLLLVKQKQRMPSKFDRDMPTFLCDFFYDWAGDMLSKGQGVSPTLDVLVATAENDDWPVHPLCISKIIVQLAKYKEISGDLVTALALCERAEAVNPEKAGVKKMIERLKKAIAKTTASN